MWKLLLLPICQGVISIILFLFSGGFAGGDKISDGFMWYLGLPSIYFLEKSSNILPNNLPDIVLVILLPATLNIIFFVIIILVLKSVLFTISK